MPFCVVHKLDQVMMQLAQAKLKNDKCILSIRNQTKSLHGYFFQLYSDEELAFLRPILPLKIDVHH